MPTTHSRVDAGSHIIVNVAAVFGLICALTAAVALLVGIRPIIFSTDSMSPAIPAGSMALTMPIQGDRIQAGDIISAHRIGDGKLVTHRAVSVMTEDNLTLLTMRGDANSVNDSTPYNVTRGARHVVWHMNGVGVFVTFLQSPWIIAGGIALVGVGLLPSTKRSSHGAPHSRHTATPLQSSENPPRHAASSHIDDPQDSIAIK